MSSQEYQVYLKSEHWSCLRKQAIERWGDRCDNCSVPSVDIHHLKYGNLLDITTDDLMPLCRRCHTAVHESGGLSLLWQSDAASNEKRFATKAFLIGRDEALRKKTKEADENKPEFSRNLKFMVNSGGFIKLTKKEAMSVVAAKTEYHWMKANGIDPSRCGWKKCLIGVSVPRVIFGRYKKR